MIGERFENDEGFTGNFPVEAARNTEAVVD